MRNYSIGPIEAKSFILNYETNGDVIKVNLANGDDYYVPNTKENKDILLAKMERQVHMVVPFEQKQEKNISEDRKRIIACSLVIAFNIFVLVIAPLVPVFTWISTAWCAFVVGLDIYDLIKSKKNLKDIKKNRLFLNNKKKINDYLSEEPEIQKETSYQMNKVPEIEQEPVYTINSIDKVKYEEIEKIVNDIERDEEFGIIRDKPKQKSLGTKKIHIYDNISKF